MFRSVGWSVTFISQYLFFNSHFLFFDLSFINWFIDLFINFDLLIYLYIDLFMYLYIHDSLFIFSSQNIYWYELPYRYNTPPFPSDLSLSPLPRTSLLIPFSPLPSQCSSCLSLFPLSILNFFPGSEPMSDAVIFEPIPYRSALRENCTHIIAVRTRAGKFANLNSNLFNSKKKIFSFV